MGKDRNALMSMNAQLAMPRQGSEESGVSGGFQASTPLFSSEGRHSSQEKQALAALGSGAEGWIMQNARQPQVRESCVCLCLLCTLGASRVN